MDWQQSISNNNCSIGVMGMGYVGFPLAVAFADHGFPVTGFDIDKDKVSQIEQGTKPIDEDVEYGLRELTEQGLLSATSDMTELADMDAVIICVPTPLRKSRDPDISHIAQATETIVDYFEPPGLIVLESTTYPGTTEEILSPAFQQAGWELGEQVHVAFSPERIDPGNSAWGIENTPKVMGGITEYSTELIADLYGAVIDDIVTVSNPRAAEMVKLLENTFRSVNIGLANEMALLCDQMDIDVWEVIDAAASKPYGFMPFYPGPGLGGHCIPIDPLFLSWKARLHDTTSQFIELADEINRDMPSHVFQKVTSALNQVQKSVNGSNVCLMGVAYKSNVADIRESPAIEVSMELQNNGADVMYCDPHVEEFSHEDGSISRITLDDFDPENFDASVILTDHDRFDWDQLLGDGGYVVVDTRNALTKALKQCQQVFETI